jgi:hypothetical protein
VSTHSKPEYDPKLWFTMEPHCKGKHYLLHASHTFPGRFTVWCSHKKRTANCSRSDIRRSSKEATYWIRGFLAGNTPEPPRGESGLFVELDDSRYRFWEQAAALFQKTGYWYEGDRICKRCRRKILPSAVLSELLCEVCSPTVRSKGKQGRRKDG